MDRGTGSEGKLLVLVHLWALKHFGAMKACDYRDEKWGAFLSSTKPKGTHHTSQGFAQQLWYSFPIHPKITKPTWLLETEDTDPDHTLASLSISSSKQTAVHWHACTVGTVHWQFIKYFLNKRIRKKKKTQLVIVWKCMWFLFLFLYFGRIDGYNENWFQRIAQVASLRRTW